VSARHELKCWTPYFDAVRTGEKPFEVRRADRKFEVGDVLWLREWTRDTAPNGTALSNWGRPRGSFTGQNLVRVITYVLAGGQFGIEPGYVVLGLSEPATSQPRGPALVADPAQLQPQGKVSR
jgi:hypothetical protein